MRALVVDDHPLIREIVSAVLAKTFGEVMVATEATLEAALACAEEVGTCHSTSARKWRHCTRRRCPDRSSVYRAWLNSLGPSSLADRTDTRSERSAHR